ncbi:hypothetical protein GCM10022222_61840 [Amycolatopsis ultiminotia]|uniref:Uncharacterized protein n=1 Tax=Amycolatopsis ultiminotia TaxID=543629 RepID=A0ABP6XRA3_9PSEU
MWIGHEDRLREHRKQFSQFVTSRTIRRSRRIGQSPQQAGLHLVANNRIRPLMTSPAQASDLTREADDRLAKQATKIPDSALVQPSRITDPAARPRGCDFVHFTDR